jgi:hypothetical protein
MLRVSLPTLYVIAAIFLVCGPPGGAGHGWGPEVAYYISMPSILFFVYVYKEGGGLILLWMFLAGVLQYFLLGYLLEALIRRARG